MADAPDMDPMGDMEPKEDMAADEMDKMMADEDQDSNKTSLTEQDLERKLIDQKEVVVSCCFHTNLIFIAVFTGLLQGYQIGLIAGTELFLSDEYRGIQKHENHPTTQEREFFVSFYSLGAAFGVLIATSINDSIGRKWTIFTGACMLLIGFILIIISGGILGGIFGRFVAGIGQGINSFAIPIWLCEVGRSTYTKIIMAVFQSFSSGGILLGLNLCIPFGHHWKWLYVGACAPVILLVIFMLFMPESPTYLIVEEQDDQVLEDLKRGLDDESAEIAFLKLKYERRFYFSKKIGYGDKCRDIFKIYLWPFSIVCIMTSLSQLCGTSAFLYYGPEIIKQTDADVTDIDEKNVADDILDNFIVIAFIVGNLISATLIYSVGRKWIVYVSIPFAVVAGGTLAYLMYEVNYGDADEQDHDIKEDYKHFDRQIFFAVLVIYVLAIAIGFSATIWAVKLEIIPNYLLSHVTGFSMTLGWLLNFAINSVFLNILDDPDGRWIIFVIVAVFALLALLFVGFCVPETVGKSVHENLCQLIGEEELRQRRRQVQNRGEEGYVGLKDLDSVKSKRVRQELEEGLNDYKHQQAY